MYELKVSIPKYPNVFLLFGAIADAIADNFTEFSAPMVMHQLRKEVWYITVVISP